MKSIVSDAAIIATPFICIITLVAVLFNANTEHAKDELSLNEACSIVREQPRGLYLNPQRPGFTTDTVSLNYDTLCND